MATTAEAVAAEIASNRRYTHRYRPYGSARQLLESRQPEILLSGPAGTGKSRACLEKISACAKKYPGSKFLIMRKTLVSLSSSALATWRKYVVDKDLRTGEVRYYGGSQEEPAQYRFANGSSVVIGGMDKPSKIMSTEYDMIFAQEATEFAEEDIEHANTRLRHGVMPYQQLIMDCNPNAPTHWLKVRCDTDICLMLHSRHEENPQYFDMVTGIPNRHGAEYMAKLDALTGVRKLRLRYGQWAAAEGVVFEQWDEARCLIDHFDPPAEWSRWWTIDFGYRNPFVCQWWAEDPDGRLYLYREIYMTGKLVEEHAATIMKQVSKPDPAYRHLGADAQLPHQGRIWTEPRPRAVICDHDAEGRATLQKYLGMSTVPAHKAVINGTQAVDSRMRSAGDGKPRIFIMRGSLVARDRELASAKKPTCTVEEIPAYVWDTAGGKKIKEDPLKEDDHGCDAMRYVVAQRDLSGRPRVRMLGGGR